MSLNVMRNILVYFVLVLSFVACSSDTTTGTGSDAGTASVADAQADAEDTADDEIEDRDVQSASCADQECVDGLPCTSDGCDDETGECVFTVLAGEPCEDGNICTSDDTCGPKGDCVPGDLVECNDDNECTEDSCNEITGCLFENTDEPCDDGSACTGNDQCQNGQCIAGDKLICDDGHDCTTDLCDPSTGCQFIASDDACNDGNVCAVGTCDVDAGCVFESVAGDCDDGNACTSDDTCVDLACTGTAKECTDGDPCTDDMCDPASGCSFPYNTAPCEDGDACTGGEACLEGACVGGSPVLCDDGDVCTIEACDSAEGCVAEDVSCDDGLDCTADSCDPVAGCSNVADDTLCNDDNTCTVDACDLIAGCTNLEIVGNCNDDDPCTEDVCTSGEGCSNPELICDDDNLCTSDTCTAGVGCEFIDGADSCDDGNACTLDGCDPAAGCTYTDDSASCDDGSLCTNDSCDPATGCVNDSILSTCDDGDACTDDSCDPFTGCVNDDITATCDDGKTCTEDSCNPLIGCTFLVLQGACDDGDACTEADTCDAATNMCVGAAVDCDDGLACTADSCDPEVGCVNTTDDALCDDSLACTTDSCDAATGCVNAPDDAVCADDGQACTVEACDALSGCGSTPDNSLCDDGIECTVDSCDGGIGCINVIDDSLCDDGVDCTVDTCDATADCGNVADDSFCDDGVACTADSCNPTAGCENVVDDSVCDDGVDCTVDTCDATADCGNVADDTSCDDGALCTVDTCDATTGCQNTPDDSLCNDGVDCSQDVCLAVGGCSSVADDSFCDDGVACTADSCNPTAGCENVVDDTVCDDGLDCTEDVCDVNFGICTSTASTEPSCVNTNEDCGAISLSNEGGINVPPLSPSTGDGTQRTIEGWVKWKPESVGETFFASDCESIVYYPFDAAFPTPTAAMFIQIFPNCDGTGSRQANYFPIGDPLPENEWVHLAVQYDSDDNTVEVFVNGSLGGENTLLSDTFSNVYDGGIGYLTDDGVAKDWANMVLDEFRISNILRYTDGDTPTTNWEPDSATLLLYDFNEGIGNVVGDLSGDTPGTFLSGSGTTWVDDGLDCSLFDADGDGFADYEGDCDDSDPDTHPYAGDTAGDGVDSDCDGLDCNADFLDDTYYLACADHVGQITADNICSSNGYDHLGGPFNAEEDAFVDALRPDLTKQYWIGLKTGLDFFGGLYWKWSDQTGLGSFVDWGPGQPVGVNVEPCVFIHEAGQWANAFCNEPRGYICEERNVVLPTPAEDLECGDVIDDSLCDDGVDCTVDTCDAALGCVYATNDTLCDDGVDCTVDTCDATTGCGNVIDESLCDDGNECTVNTCIIGTGCTSDNVVGQTGGSIGFDKDVSPGYEAYTTAYDGPFNAFAGAGGAVITDGDDGSAVFANISSTFAWLEYDLDLSSVPGEITGEMVAVAGSDGPVVTGCYYYMDSGDPVNVLCAGDATLFDQLPVGCDNPVVLDGTPIQFTLPAGTETFACKHYTNALTDIISVQKLMFTWEDEVPGCDDGLSCIENEACNAGVCEGTAVNCDDGVACTQDSCDESSGCQNVSEDSACDDGVDCTADSCDAVAGCVNATDDSFCDDGNVCTLNTCDASTGCETTDAPASDGDSKGFDADETVGDAKFFAPDGGPFTVYGGIGGSVYDTNGDGSITLDNISSVVAGVEYQLELDEFAGDVSVELVATHGATENVVSACFYYDETSTPINLFCSGDSNLYVELPAGCDAPIDLDGTPVNFTVPAGVDYLFCEHYTDANIAFVTISKFVASEGNEPLACDDGDACTDNDSCAAGSCVSGDILSCDDGNPCTIDACDPTLGCTYEDDPTCCGGVNFCNEDNTGETVGGVPAFIKQNPPTAGANFGWDMALAGDWMAVTEHGTAVHMYREVAGEWSLQQSLLNPTGVSTSFFGHEVVMDGATMVVSSPQETGGGILHVYELSNDAWALSTSFTADDANSNDYLGISMDLQGDILVAGATGDNELSAVSGAVYIFRSTASGWTQEAKVYNTDLSDVDDFGYSVALDNGVLAVGAPIEFYEGGGGAVLFFNEDGGAWTFDAKIHPANTSGGNEFGYGIDLDGDTFVGGAIYSGIYDGTGYAVVYRKISGVWTEQETLQGPPNDLNSVDHFGNNVVLKNGLLAVGAPQFDEDVSGDGAGGAVVVFEEFGGVFSQTSVLTQPAGATDHQFGFSIAYDGTYLLAGVDTGIVAGSNSTPLVGSLGVDGFDGEGGVYVFGATFACNPEGTCACMSGYTGDTCDIPE